MKRIRGKVKWLNPEGRGLIIANGQVFTLEPGSHEEPLKDEDSVTFEPVNVITEWIAINVVKGGSNESI